MQVTMTMEDYKALETARDDALKKVAELEAQLTAARQNGDTNDLRSLNALARKLLDCTRFAVGQMPPETIKKWPWRRLVEIADLMGVLPDYNVDDVSITSEFRAFAKECERAETIRAERSTETSGEIASTR